ncbi:MAG: hypothetical protein FJX76_17630 [Armatimonadetes bacterium]|nr:hypothetical protein [Armatimonadota bacterium]
MVTAVGLLYAGEKLVANLVLDEFDYQWVMIVIILLFILFFPFKYTGRRRRRRRKHRSAKGDDRAQ